MRDRVAEHPGRGRWIVSQLDLRRFGHLGQRSILVSECKSYVIPGNLRSNVTFKDGEYESTSSTPDGRIASEGRDFSSLAHWLYGSCAAQKLS